MKLIYATLIALAFPVISMTGVKQNPGDSTKTCFLRIDNRKWPDFHPSEFMLTASMGDATWSSGWLRPIDNNNLGFLIKVSVPIKVLTLNPMLDCSSRGFESFGGVLDTTRLSTMLKYTGVFTNNIKLSLISEPKRADVFVIPNRVWQNTVKNRWKHDKSVLQDYLVADDKTDVDIDIDETVYVVMFCLNDKYLIRTLHTLPKASAPNQKVTVTFN